MAKNLLLHLTSIATVLTTLCLKIPVTGAIVPSTKQDWVTPQHLAQDRASQTKGDSSAQPEPENIFAVSHPLDLAQLPVPLPPDQDLIPPDTPADIFQPSPSKPLEPGPPQPLPPPEELLRPPGSTPAVPEVPEEVIPKKITIKRFEFIGNT
ncbi:MAG: hypothetical protein F6K47_19660, partial [Symploca sp. SIO2E6]|nr:hypothetical protein [Symploca sp. SIO2E6]